MQKGYGHFSPMLNRADNQLTGLWSSRRKGMSFLYGRQLMGVQTRDGTPFESGQVELCQCANHDARDICDIR